MHQVRSTLFLLAALAATACVDSPEELAVDEAEVLSGTVVSPWTAIGNAHLRGIVNIDYNCTGTMLTSQWVLTAKHCGFVAGAQVHSIRPATTITRVVDRVANHPTRDVMMLHLSQPMPADVPTMGLYAGTAASIYGQTVSCYGYGAKAASLPNASGVCPATTFEKGGWCLTPSTELRTANLLTGQADAGYFSTAKNSLGQLTLPGDSGGPCFVGAQQVGVNSWWNLDLSGGGAASIPEIRRWIDRTLKPAVKADYDGDGKTDLAVWRPSTATWYVLKSTGGTATNTNGQSTDLPVLGDYDGDGKTDFATWRPSNGMWTYKWSSGSLTISEFVGKVGDLPVPGDYDGDGKTDLAVWRPSNGNWIIKKSADGQTTTQQWGMQGDVPVQGDYDGDMRADLAVWRPSDGTWYVIRSSTGGWFPQQWGMAGDAPVSGDYDGDGLRDFAVGRPSDNRWYMLPSSTLAGYWQGWGQAGDQRSPGDYNGDGRTDLAFFRAADHIWYVWLTGGSAYFQGGWGDPGDISASSLRF